MRDAVGTSTELDKGKENIDGGGMKETLSRREKSKRPAA